MVAPTSRSASPLAGDAPWPLRLVLFGAWAAIALWLAAHHVFWRDEVRALSFALSGDDVAAMWRTVRGDGHPALWFLLLRGAHAVVASVRVLPGVAMLVGAAAAALIAARAPFRPLVLAACLLSGWLAYDYSVMARDYGIAALLILLLARRRAGGRRGGVGTGLLLALLCNADVPAIAIAGGLVLFDAIECGRDGGWRPGAHWRPVLVAAALAAVGVALAVATVYPPFNDAATQPIGPLPPARLAALIGGVGTSMAPLVPFVDAGGRAGSLVVTLMLLAGPLSLARAPAAMAAAAAVLVVLGLFFQLVYPASSQHAALYLVFVLALHWIVAARPATRRIDLAAVGAAGFVALLLVQSAVLAAIVERTRTGAVASRSRDLALLLAHHRLGDATVIADSDSLVEALPYYAGNRLYLVRERRWSAIPHYTRHAIVDLTLGELLATARRLQESTARPVVLLVALPLDGAAAPRLVDGYRRTTRATADQIRALRAATTRLARFGPVTTDERYDVYLLHPRNRFLAPPGR